MHIPPHHYPFQNTLPTIDVAQPVAPPETHADVCDEKNEAPIERFIYHFDYKKWLKDQREEWKNFDHNCAKAITDFKEEYIFSLGDVRLRSACMFVSAGLFYLMISLHKPSMLGRVRNLAVSFGLNGYLWIP